MESASHEPGNARLVLDEKDARVSFVGSVGLSHTPLHAERRWYSPPNAIRGSACYAGPAPVFRACATDSGVATTSAGTGSGAPAAQAWTAAIRSGRNSPTGVVRRSVKRSVC